MKRDLVINIVLIVVGVVLAFLLFAAGVLWKSKTSTGRPSASIAGPAEQTERARPLPAQDACRCDVGVQYRRAMLTSARLLCSVHGWRTVTSSSANATAYSGTEAGLVIDNGPLHCLVYSILFLLTTDD
jgi:hypothetical protein